MDGPSRGIRGHVLANSPCFEGNLRILVAEITSQVPERRSTSPLVLFVVCILLFGSVPCPSSKLLGGPSIGGRTPMVPLNTSPERMVLNPDMRVASPFLLGGGRRCVRCV